LLPTAYREPDPREELYYVAGVEQFPEDMELPQADEHRRLQAELPHSRGVIESGGWFQYFRFPSVPKGEEYALKLVGTVEEDLR
jgi:hypothetical protein